MVFVRLVCRPKGEKGACSVCAGAGRSRPQVDADGGVVMFFPLRREHLSNSCISACTILHTPSFQLNCRWTACFFCLLLFLICCMCQPLPSLINQLIVSNAIQQKRNQLHFAATTSHTETSGAERGDLADRVMSH